MKLMRRTSYFDSYCRNVAAYEEFQNDELTRKPRYSIRKLLKKHPDYRSGPCKIYTKEEVQEYNDEQVRNRASKEGR